MRKHNLCEKCVYRNDGDICKACLKGEITIGDVMNRKEAWLNLKEAMLESLEPFLLPIVKGLDKFLTKLSTVSKKRKKKQKKIWRG